QEGTYPLPEAQLDRFLMHVRIDYPAVDEERAILQLARGEARQNAPSVLPESQMDQQALFAARDQVLAMHMAESLEAYLLQIVLATRTPEIYSDTLASWIEYGASPRATIALDRCARAHAWLAGRDFVTPEDIQSLACDVLRHRVLLSYEAEAEGVTPDQFVEEILALVAVP
ncbi:MAG: MoxR family ATPase, partial [Gammaproteobacteria bacterium]|nr:MoxR family ATPase [Gammaproteobacteria bacterium]